MHKFLSFSIYLFLVMILSLQKINLIVLHLFIPCYDFVTTENKFDRPPFIYSLL